MTGALDRACEAAWDAYFTGNPPAVAQNPADRSFQRAVAAALRVMADDIRAEHPLYDDPPEPTPMCERCLHGWPCPTVRILNDYTGSAT